MYNTLISQQEFARTIYGASGKARDKALQQGQAVREHGAECLDMWAKIGAAPLAHNRGKLAPAPCNLTGGYGRAFVRPGPRPLTAGERMVAEYIKGRKALRIERRRGRQPLRVLFARATA